MPINASLVPSFPGSPWALLGWELHRVQSPSADSIWEGCSLDHTMRGCLGSPLAVLLLALPLLEAAEQNPGPPVSSRILGGQDAQESQWPWPVSVQVNGSHVCGGSLVSTQWVVSAAHCFNLSVPYSQYRLVLGAHQLLNPSPNQILAEVQKIIPHPSYNSKSSLADIALVRLKEPVATTKFIGPISLPGASRQFPVGKMCSVTGWGDVGAHKPYSKILQQLEVPILSTATCNGHYNPFVPGAEVDPVKSDMICAGYMHSNKGFCKGDSWNPLVCQQDGTWYLAGVLSSFMNSITNEVICLEAGYPGVFTQVTAFDSWIQRHVNSVGPAASASPAS
ncbi:serine protease 27-like [Emys orbicularis]|uniref:serine protease 27-like n=1 Tax=Emys orbicularis TaxID=82168 RepID=UPI0031FD8C57